MRKCKILICILTFVLLSGCSSYYQSIPKDTVMVKKIAQVSSENKIKNPGVLSEETVKTLSLNAINKLFDTNFSFEDVNIQANLFDLKQIKSMLYSFLGDSDVDPLVQYKTELSTISNGLFSVSVTNQYTAQVQYTIMIDATNGDVLEVQKYVGSHASNNTGVATSDEIIGTAKQLLGQIEGIDLLDYEQPRILKERKQALVVFENKKTKNDGVILSFDVKTKELWSYSKDITTILSYSYLNR